MKPLGMRDKNSIRKLEEENEKFLAEVSGKGIWKRLMYLLAYIGKNITLKEVNLIHIFNDNHHLFIYSGFVTMLWVKGTPNIPLPFYLYFT